MYSVAKRTMHRPQLFGKGAQSLFKGHKDVYTTEKNTKQSRNG